MAKEYYAQHGEDRILDRIFPSASGLFVEVGAADGVEGSNTLHFEQRGWTGILIEANPRLAELCRSTRRSPVVECAVTAPGSPASLPFQIVLEIPQLSGLSLDAETLRKYGVGELETILVPCSTLDDVLSEHLLGQNLDFVTIDVEGHEWKVLQGFSIDIWKPKVVIIERNFQPEWRILRFMHRHGYAYTRTTGVNDWFERGVGQSSGQLVRFALPKYLLGLRPLMKNTLARLHLLEWAARLKRRVWVSRLRSAPKA